MANNQNQYNNNTQNPGNGNTKGRKETLEYNPDMVREMKGLYDLTMKVGDMAGGITPKGETEEYHNEKGELIARSRPGDDIEITTYVDVDAKEYKIGGTKIGDIKITVHKMGKGGTEQITVECPGCAVSAINYGGGDKDKFVIGTLKRGPGDISYFNGTNINGKDLSKCVELEGVSVEEYRNVMDNITSTLIEAERKIQQNLTSDPLIRINNGINNGINM